MKNNFGGRLKTQLIIAFMAIITVMMVFVAAFTYKKVAAVIERLSADITQQYFQQNEYNIQSLADETNKLLTFLTQSDSVYRYIRTGWREDFDVIMNANSIFDEITRITGNYDYVDSVYFYGDNGVVIGNNGKENIVIQTTDKSQFFYQSEMYNRALENPWEVVWFGVYDSNCFEGSKTMRSQEAVPYVTAVYSINVVGRHVATVVLNIVQDTLADSIGYADEGNRRESFLVNEDGIIVVHREREKRGVKMNLPETEKEQDNYFIQDGVQVNYRKLKGQKNIPWMLISEVPIAVLHEEIYSLRQWFVLTVLIALFVALALSMYWMYRLMKPLNELRKAMERMEHGQLGGLLKTDSRNELGVLGRQFNQMSQSIEKLVHQIQETENEKRFLEKEVLRAQISPHFLFNTLTNIKYMAIFAGSETIAESITALGNILAPIYKSNGDVWRVREEIEYIKNYVKIMNARFGDKIDIFYEIEKEIDETYILKFILQPLVENSIHHGFSERGGRGKIWIRLSHDIQYLYIVVEDDGCGMSETKLETVRAALNASRENVENNKETHIGLTNVHRRLQIYYGNSFGVTINSSFGGGTLVSLKLPGFTRI